MTFFPEFGADKSIVFHETVVSPPSKWIHNDSVCVRFGGIRNTKTLSKSSCGSVHLISG